MNQKTLPSLDLLRTFEVVARHLSFTRAAAELFVTQSAVSRQVRQLEEHLGVRLFERRTRAVVLTDVGYRYYGEIAPLLADIEKVTAEVTARRAETRVRVTSTLSFASLWLVPRLAVFQEKHADIQVHVVADNVMRDLVRDDFDAAIRYCTAADAPGAVKLFDETLAPVCSPELLARTRVNSVDALARLPLIHFSDLEGRAPWLSWDLYFAQSGHAGVRGNGAVYFSHYDQAIRAARAGQGVALGRLPLIDTALQDGGLVAPLGPGARVAVPDRSYWLTLPPARERKPEVDLFTSWLREAARRSDSAQAAPTRSSRA